MKKTLLIAFALCICLAAGAQSAEEFRQQYLRQTGVAGAGGLGVKTILDSWEAAFPDDTLMLEAKFFYSLAKARGSTVEMRKEKKYLGREASFSLKDSLGNENYFYELPLYDEEYFAQSQRALDRAILLSPKNIGYRFYEITSLLDYEGESPDMAVNALLNLIDLHYSERPDWNMDGQPFTGSAFPDAVKEYCYALWKLGTPAGYEYFRSVSETMLRYNSKDVGFIDNLGSYWQVCKRNYKKAAKYYKKALALAPDDYAANHNLQILKKQQSK